MSTDSLKERLAQLHLFSLKMIQHSSLDTLLEQIAMVACQQTNASSVSVNLREDGNKPGRAFSVNARQDGIQPVENPAYAQNFFSAMLQESISARFPPEYRAKLISLVDAHPDVKSFLYVPILQGNSLLGQILMVNKLNEPAFSSDDQRVIETLAAYAEIALSNNILRARLAQRDLILTRRNENLALLSELSSTLSSTNDIDQMLEQTLVRVVDSLQLDAGEIYLSPENSNRYQLVLHYGDVIGQFWKEPAYEFGRGIIGKTAQNRQPLLMDLPDEEITDLHESMQKKLIRQVGCFSISGSGKSLGVLCIATSQTQPLDAIEIQSLAIISSWISTVIENARLNLQQRRLAVLEERDRIGMDLHDGIIQSIYAVGLTLEHARLLLKEDPRKADQRINQAIRDLNNTIRDLRSYILDLRPRHMQDENLVQGIQRLVTEFHTNTLVKIDLLGSKESFRDLSKSQMLALFHICQEALANVAKHARASQVNVNLWTVSERALLEVHDNGRGFDVNEVKLSLGHGLSNMQMRARNAGGDVDISSEPGGGTTMLAWVPFVREIQGQSENLPLSPSNGKF